MARLIYYSNFLSAKSGSYLVLCCLTDPAQHGTAENISVHRKACAGDNLIKSSLSILSGTGESKNSLADEEGTGRTVAPCQ